MNAKQLLEGITPGKWQIATNSERDIESYNPANGFRTEDQIWKIALGCQYDSRGRNNARLIAAAPDLARRVIALEAAIENMLCGSDNDDFGRCIECNEAIEYDRCDNDECDRFIARKLLEEGE